MSLLRGCKFALEAEAETSMLKSPKHISNDVFVTIDKKMGSKLSKNSYAGIAEDGRQIKQQGAEAKNYHSV